MKFQLFFSFGEQFFEDQIRRPGIRTAPHNPYAGHTILCRGPQFGPRAASLTALM